MVHPHSTGTSRLPEGPRPRHLSKRTANPCPEGSSNRRRRAGEGLSAGEIAQKLNLSHGNVRNYLSEAIGKLGVGNRIEAYRLARQKGWL